MTPAERQRLEAVMPFYVNGSADERDRAFVDAMLADGQAQAMLAWHEGLARKVRLDVDAVNDDIGWAALAARVRAQRPEATVRAPSGWRAWFSRDRWPSRALQAPALALLSLVVVGQGVLLYRHGEPPVAEGGYGEIRGEAGPAAVPGGEAVALKVNFKDEASEHDLRMLLLSTGANIVQGPGQLGDYVLAVPAARAGAAEQELRASKWVNSVRRANLPAPAPTR